MKVGFLFPGQGAQTLGMGKDIYDKYESVQKIYNQVKEITGIDIAKISFEGPEEDLNQTRYTQLAILTMSLGILKVLEESGIKAEASLGLSLGEYTALIASNSIFFEDGIKLVKNRGAYMQDLLPDGEWQMAAVLGLEEALVEEACKKVEDSFVVPTNYNCPGQIVISGEKLGIEKATEYLKDMGARKVRALNTSGPFHTIKLIESSKALAKDLKQIDFSKPENKVVKNLDGEFYQETDNIAEVLEKHMINSIRISKGLQTMIKDGIDTFIEIGPGKTLSEFVRKIETENEITRYTTNNLENLEETIKNIKEAL